MFLLTRFTFFWEEKMAASFWLGLRSLLFQLGLLFFVGFGFFNWSVICFPSSLLLWWLTIACLQLLDRVRCLWIWYVLPPFAFLNWYLNSMHFCRWWLGHLYRLNSYICVRINLIEFVKFFISATWWCLNDWDRFWLFHMRVILILASHGFDVDLFIFLAWLVTALIHFRDLWYLTLSHAYFRLV